MKPHHYNLTNPRTPTVYEARTIKKGVTAHFHPTFERGDTQTRKFAEYSKECLENGGITIAFHSTPDKASIIRAMSILQGLLRAAIR